MPGARTAACVLALVLGVGCGRVLYEPVAPRADAGPPDAGPPLARVTALCAGAVHTCALVEGGDVYCWGVGTDGRLGTGSLATIGDDEPASMATAVPLGAPATAITCGAIHACALTDGGEVYCWGDGRFGRLGYGNDLDVGDDETPEDVGPVAVGGTALAVSAGRDHTCAVLTGSQVRCWGMNFAGALGIGTAGATAHVGDDELPSDVPPVDLGFSATVLAAGARGSCVLDVAGALLCFGEGTDGVLGTGSTTSIGDDEAPNGVIAPVGIDSSVTQWDSEFHTCTVVGTGSVYCFGLSERGRLGYPGVLRVGDDELPAAAGTVNVGAAVRTVAAGLFHTCALLRDGRVRCWGMGASGQLGNLVTTTIGDDEEPIVFPPVDLGFAAETITAGDNHTCALSAEGTVACWGKNDRGQLGYGHTRDIGDDEPPASERIVPLRL